MFNHTCLIEHLLNTVIFFTNITFSRKLSFITLRGVGCSNVCFGDASDFSNIADSAQTEYCSTFQCVLVCQLVTGVSHLKFSEKIILIV